MYKDITVYFGNTEGVEEDCDSLFEADVDELLEREEDSNSMLRSFE